MQTKLSRRKIADYVAQQLTAGESVETLVMQVAAYLIESRRVREVDLVVRAIEDALMRRSVTVATVTSAQSLDESMRATITQLLNAPTVHLREQVDPAVIGGVRIVTPTSRLDQTIIRKLLALRQAKQ
ncbi:hypothetical protein EOL96_02285 [Candidatus Saccharibacteria bacterium]|nr:hypothetical protein [Candidatus Saccharibacteria bacterium]